MKKQLEALVEQMLDGQILLGEALDEFEKVFILRALERNDSHLSNTAEILGLHRNTVAKKVAGYNGARPSKPGPGKIGRKKKKT